MSSPDAGAEQVRSIKALRAVFERRADLDAFWVATVDFSKDKVGLSTHLLRRGESRVEFTGFPTAFLAKEQTLPTCEQAEPEEEDAQRQHDSWRDLHLQGSFAVTLHT